MPAAKTPAAKSAGIEDVVKRILEAVVQFEEHSNLSVRLVLAELKKIAEEILGDTPAAGAEEEPEAEPEAEAE